MIRSGGISQILQVTPYCSGLQKVWSRHPKLKVTMSSPIRLAVRDRCRENVFELTPPFLFYNC